MSQSSRKILLRNIQSPGDVVMLTAAVRDLKTAYPEFAIDVRSYAPELWENNPHLTRLDESDPEVEVIDTEYPLIQRSNWLPYHFIHGFRLFLEEQLGVRIPAGPFRGDIHLTQEEKERASKVQDIVGDDRPFWIMVAGGKFDFTAKWWPPSYYQQVVDALKDRIVFVQCGAMGHWHPRLKGVIDLVGKTRGREFIRLMYHARGVVCPVTMAMHLAAAVETKHSPPRNRPCVVVAGGREPPQWEAYPHHQFLHVNGALDCCDDGGCWKHQCQVVGDVADPDRLCLKPVQVHNKLSIPRCMMMIEPDRVVSAIELYLEGGLHPASGLP